MESKTKLLIVSYTDILLGIASLLGIIAVMFLTCLSALILLIKKSKQKKERNPGKMYTKTLVIS